MREELAAQVEHHVLLHLRVHVVVDHSHPVAHSRDQEAADDDEDEENEDEEDEGAELVDEESVDEVVGRGVVSATGEGEGTKR